MLVPRRRRGVEILDDPATDPALRARSLRDIVRSNVLFGGRRAVLAELSRVMESLADRASLLDVGTGLGDIPCRARERARREGKTIVAFGVDEAASLARACAGVLDGGVCADVRRLPFADGSVDVVTCSQLLHHFPDDEIARVICELDRVARVTVVICDLRRSWLAACAFWLASWPLGFHRITRHDGFVSVLRGFTADELSRHVLGALGQRAVVRRHLGFRISATWSKKLV